MNDLSVVTISFTVAGVEESVGSADVEAEMYDSVLSSIVKTSRTPERKYKLYKGKLIHEVLIVQDE